MTRKEFIQTMAVKTGSSKADMDVTVGALLEVISDTLKKGDSITFRYRVMLHRGKTDSKELDEVFQQFAAIP